VGGSLRLPAPSTWPRGAMGGLDVMAGGVALWVWRVSLLASTCGLGTWLPGGAVPLRGFECTGPLSLIRGISMFSPLGVMGRTYFQPCDAFNFPPFFTYQCSDPDPWLLVSATLFWLLGRSRVGKGVRFFTLLRVLFFCGDSSSDLVRLCPWSWVSSCSRACGSCSPRNDGGAKLARVHCL